MGALRRTQVEGRWQGWMSPGWMKRSKSSLGRAGRPLTRHYGRACLEFWPLAVCSLAMWRFRHRRWEKHLGGERARMGIGDGGSVGIERGLL